jgi:hypothetical protein
MSDFEHQPTPTYRAPGAAFEHALRDCEKRCARLTNLLGRREFAHVVDLARSAGDLWLTGRAAYRRIVDREPANSPTAETARARLNAAFLPLLDVVRRARAQSRSHAIQSRLDDLRIELITAAAEPITKAGPTAELAELPSADITQEMALDD